MGLRGKLRMVPSCRSVVLSIYDYCCRFSLAGDVSVGHMSGCDFQFVP